MAGYQKRHAVLFLQHPQQIPDLLHPARVQSVGRLVEYDQLRPAENPPAPMSMYYGIPLKYEKKNYDFYSQQNQQHRQQHRTG